MNSSPRHLPPRRPRRPIRGDPSRLPPAPPPPPSRGSFLFPWLLATGAGALFLLLFAMALVKPLGLLPFERYPTVADAIALGALAVAAAGGLLALVRRFRRPR